MSPLTSGRLSHSSEAPLNGGGSLTGTDSPPISPSDEFDDVVKVSFALLFHLFFCSGVEVGPQRSSWNSGFSQVQQFCCSKLSTWLFNCFQKNLSSKKNDDNKLGHK